MSIPSWLLKPVIREVVKTMLKEIFENYATKVAALLTILIVGVCTILKVPAESITSFVTTATIMVGVLGGQSVSAKWADAYKAKNGNTEVKQ